MFTGIIEEVGEIARVDRGPGGTKLGVKCRVVLEDSRPGDSIAVNGVCLTVEKVEAGFFTCTVSAESLDRTVLGKARAGEPVNLERALALGGRIGGHLVSGHVEAVGRIESLVKEGRSSTLVVSFPPDFSQYIVDKGSVAVDGVSLTVASREKARFRVSIVPETFEKTTFALKRSGDSVNLEPDLILKYVRSVIGALGGTESGSELTLAKLLRSGFITD